jgi:hypothetical protein
MRLCTFAGRCTATHPRRRWIARLGGAPPLGPPPLAGPSSAPPPDEASRGAPTPGALPGDEPGPRRQQPPGSHGCERRLPLGCLLVARWCHSRRWGRMKTHLPFGCGCTCKRLPTRHMTGAEARLRPPPLWSTHLQTAGGTAFPGRQATTGSRSWGAWLAPTPTASTTCRRQALPPNAGTQAHRHRGTQTHCRPGGSPVTASRASAGAGW